MSLLHSFTSGLRALFRRDQRNAEIHEELSSFLDASVAHKMRLGMSREQALRAARAEIGSAEAVRHKVWSAGWESFVDSLWQDVRIAVRQIVRSPASSAVAILSLALGIGANTAIFTLMNDLLLKRLPVHDPQQLVSFGEGNIDGTMELSNPGPIDIFPYEFYRRISAKQDQFQGITAFASFPTMVSVRTGSAGPATQATSHLVSGNFFSVLGADPLLGRTLSPADTAVTGRNPVAVISHRYWQQALASDPQVIGHILTIDGTAFTVVGVMPPQFYGVSLDEWLPDMWLPITMQPQVMQGPSLLNPDGLFWIHMMARRHPGIPAGKTQAWVTAQLQQFLIDRAGGQITNDRRNAIAGSYIPLLPGESGISPMRSHLRAPLAVLMGIVGMVLLIACANLANLLLARAAAREHEFSTRLALGCNRARIIRQILTETLVLALAGGAVGLAFAFLGTRVLIAFIAGSGAHSALSATPDLRVLAFTFTVCIVTGLLFGITPAWRGSRSSAAGALNATTRTATGAARHRGRLLPRTLVVVQVVLSLVLLAGAGLLLRSLHNLRAQDLGFNRTNVLLIRTNPKFAGYRPEQLNALYNRVLERIDALPGVRSATLSGAPPMSRGTWGSPIFIDGRPAAPNEDVSTMLNRVTAGYFETLGIPLLRGRTIGSDDTASSTKAVVINQTLADRYFPKGDAIGHTFRIADPAVPGTWQIVGIVRDTKYHGPADQPEPMAWLAVEQITGDDQFAYCLQILTSGDPAAITSEVRSALVQIDPNLPILETATLAEEVDTLLDLPKFLTRLSGFFSALALLLACIGLYGVMSYNVVRRTSEIGIRMALGAARSRVLWMVLRESLLLLGIGLALGIPASLAAARVIRAGLFGITPTDPLTLAAAVLMLTGVILFAAWLPARKATRIDPVIALRYE